MMPSTIVCQKHLKLVFSILMVLSFFNSQSQNLPLTNAFAHNDYWHKHPLFDALDNGFTHIEADIYLRNSKLIVAHFLPVFKMDRTLERLYLDPLYTRIKQNDKLIYPGYPIILMIDIKSEANRTYLALELLLEKYKAILTSYQDGIITQRQVTIVLTGHKPIDLLKLQHNRVAFIDEDLRKVKQDTLNNNVYLTASCKYSHLLNWTGTGSLPAIEREKLCAYVKMAHQYGKQVRLWASPENKAVWRELLNCGVDLINTDQLVTLRNFLLNNTTSYARLESATKHQ